MYNGPLINSGRVHQMALSRNKAFIYATVIDDDSYWYLNIETASWDKKQECNQIEIDDDSKLWCRKNGVIVDLEGGTYSADACTDFVVDEMYFFCLRYNDKVYRRHKSNAVYEEKAKGMYTHYLVMCCSFATF